MKIDVTLKYYEIFFVHYGVRKRVVYEAHTMESSIAWRIAAVESGVAPSVLPSGNVLSQMVTAVRAEGISEVRWNHAFDYARRRYTD